MKKQRIPVSGSAGGMQSPFAGLEISGPPEGPSSDPGEPGQPQQAPGRVVLRKEKSGRGGKSVIVVSGFRDDITITRIADLARLARQKCGCGGTVTGREIELQGDQPDRVRTFFEDEGFRVGGI